MSRRITLKDIAKRYGVSIAAVSYAMRNDPRIPPSTRSAIQKLAAEMGYRPDPFLSALVSYRPDVKVKSLMGEIAIIHPCERNSPHTVLFRRHRDSFGKRMTDHGYVVTDLYLDELKFSSKRLRQILLARNIRGVAIGWGFQRGMLADFPWDEFVVISTERVIIHPSLDRISMNHFRSVQDVMDKIRARGHRRIGLIYHNDAPTVVKKNLIGSYFAEITLGAGKRIPCLPAFEYTRNESAERFLKWFRKNRPEALLAHRRVEHGFFHSAGIRFPVDCGYAVAEIDDAEPGLDSGIYVAETMGQTLADMLVRKVATYANVNLESKGTMVMVNGVWHDGITL